MLVREVMTTSPVTVRPGTTVQAALRLAAQAHVTSLPVVDAAGQLRGIVSKADLIKDRVPVDPRLHEPAHPGDLPDRHDLVEQVMTRVLAGSDADLHRDITCALTCIGLRDWLVEVHDGAVDLTGPSDPDAVDLARLAAATVPGVTSVRILAS